MEQRSGEKKKICFIVYNLSLVRGDVRAATLVANELCAFHDVTLLSMLGEEIHPAYHIDGRIHCRLLRWQEERLLGYGKKILPLQQQLQAAGTDVAVLVGTFIGYIFSRYPWGGGCRCVFWDHGALRSQLDVKTLLIRYFAARRCDAVVVLTDRNLQDYRRFFHTRRDKLRRIYNWVERTQEHCDIEARRIISVGRVDSEKGYDLAVEAARHVLPDHPSWTWHIYGTGDEMEKIRAMIDQYGLGRQMVLEGTSNQISREYCRSSILVLPSYREGLPLVLLEALNYALPMVSFNVATGPEEIIDDGQTGFLIRPYDTRAMAEKMALLMDQPALRRAMSEKAASYIGRFERSVIVDEWLQLIEDMIDAGKKRR